MPGRNIAGGFRRKISRKFFLRHSSTTDLCSWAAPPWRRPPERFPVRYNSDEDQRLTIRLEDDLREALTAEARQQLRSLCSEIKFRLRQSLERQDEATA
jgi:hypothetical protein